MKKISAFVFLLIFIFQIKGYAASYSFLFGIPDSVTIGDGETEIVFSGRIINNGDYPIFLYGSGGGTGNDPSSSPYPWWSTNYWEYWVEHVHDVQPGETRDFQLGIYRDDPLIDRDSQFLQCFFLIADLDGDGIDDIETPYQYWDSTGWIFDDMAKTLVTFGGTSFVSTNYYYVQSTLSPTFNPIPIPSAIWLLGSGLIGIVGIRRKFKN